MFACLEQETKGVVFSCFFFVYIYIYISPNNDILLLIFELKPR